MFYILLPSFLHPSSHHSRKNTPNSALQGLRGLAAAIVFHRHLLISFSPFPDYGYNPASSNEWIHQLPFIRLVYSGGAMVQMFFIISGYTQSLKPLQQMRNEQWDAVHRTLCSAVFRRGFRLFFPTFVAAMCVAVAIWAGLYEWGREYRDTWFDPDPNAIVRERNLLRQIWVVFRSFKGLIDVWHWDEYFPDFNPHMWTIAVEFRCSLVVQFTLLGLSMMKPVPRIFILMSLMWYCHFYGRWDFPTGIERPTVWRGGWTETRNSLQFAVFVAGLYLMGYPKKEGLNTPGYRTIASLNPSTWVDHRFWSACGAFLVVASVTNSPIHARLFEIGLFQYLGKISYAMYLVHGPVLHVTSFVFVPMMWLVTGKENIVCRVLGFEVAAWIGTVPVLIWTADLFWRFADVPSGNFTFWLKTKVFVE